MSRSLEAAAIAAATHNSRRSLPIFFAVCAIESIAGALLTLGIFFYTKNQFHWGATQNYLLAMCQGAIYIVGALLASPLQRRWGRRNLLLLLYIILAAITGTAATQTSTFSITTLILAHTFVIAATWPMVESLVSTDADAHELSRRLGIYNLIWSFTGTAAVALSGKLIDRWPASFFVICTFCHCAGASLMFFSRRLASNAPSESASHAPRPLPEAALFRQRRRALWLSRISLPATYVVIYGLSALMPSLPVIERLPTQSATLLSSVWLAARWLAFLILGATLWWHTRPMLLLWANILMLAAFLGIVLPGARSAADAGSAITYMIAWQVALGFAMGIIYSGSLYFGMVLSDGSTEHGGYHEALVGVGQVLGPAAGALGQWLRPEGVHGGVAAIATIIALTAIAAASIAIQTRPTSQ